MTNLKLVTLITLLANNQNVRPSGILHCTMLFHAKTYAPAQKLNLDMDELQVQYRLQYDRAEKGG